MRHLAFVLVFAIIAACSGMLFAGDGPPGPVVTAPAAPAPVAPAPAPADVHPVDRKRLAPTVGRVVYFVLDGPRKGEIRPAIIVRVNGEGDEQTCNLSVLLDGENDVGKAHVRWVGSASHDQDGQAPGTWHWMPFQINQADKMDDAATLRDEIAAFMSSELGMALEKAMAERSAESARAGAAEGRERDLLVKIETMERDAKHGHRA